MLHHKNCDILNTDEDGTGEDRIAAVGKGIKQEWATRI